MALTADEIMALRPLYSQIRVQSRSLLEMFESNMRLSAPFATQQRWLMSHVGLKFYFLSLANPEKTPGLNISHFIDQVHKHGIASRNTADSYIKEMVHYKYIIQLEDPTDKRLKPLVPSEEALLSIAGWLQIHLHSLDVLTGGNRLAIFREQPSLMAAIQPSIADGLIHAHAVRSPERTFSLFTWLDNGGVVMDWLITCMPDTPPETERVPVGRISVGDLAAKLNLSRTHLARKLREAEELGSIGWEGRRGHSVMWVSRGFRREYAAAQAAKLSIIDHAFEQATASSMAA